MWGATHSPQRLFPPLPISIHAPRVGRDEMFGLMPCKPSRFQSTRPVWGATDTEDAPPMSEGISIHAPRVGRDCASVAHRGASDHFNPRAPCGARLVRFALISEMYTFQSTRPVWGATVETMADGKQYLFQSTRPVWGATTAMNCVKDVHIISIHAPRVGRDKE